MNSDRSEADHVADLRRLLFEQSAKVDRMASRGDLCDLRTEHKVLQEVRRELLEAEMLKLTECKLIQSGE